MLKGNWISCRQKKRKGRGIINDSEFKSTSKKDGLPFQFSPSYFVNGNGIGFVPKLQHRAQLCRAEKQRRMRTITGTPYVDLVQDNLFPVLYCCVLPLSLSLSESAGLHRPARWRQIEEVPQEASFHTHKSVHTRFSSLFLKFVDISFIMHGGSFNLIKWSLWWLIILELWSFSVTPTALLHTGFTPETTTGLKWPLEQTKWWQECGRSDRNSHHTVL